MKRLVLTLLVGLLFASLILTGCEKRNVNQKIRVATDATWPPFEMVDENTKEIVGFDIELLTAIAEKEGLDIEFINVSWDPLLAGIAECQYDVAISAIAILEERKSSMLFSDPYYSTGQIITVQKNETSINSQDNLSGKIVGTLLGTTAEFAVKEIDGVILKTYDEIGLAFQDLLNGQIDAVVADYPLSLGYVQQNPEKIKTVGLMLNSEDFGIVVCKSKPELLEKINKGLAAVKSEGIIDELSEKWIPGSN